MRSFFFCLAFVLPGLAAYAQEADSTELRFGTFISVYSLYPPALTDLNRQLDAAERLDLRDNILGVSLGFTQRFADQNSYLATRFTFFSPPIQKTVTIIPVSGFGNCPPPATTT